MDPDGEDSDKSRRSTYLDNILSPQAIPTEVASQSSPSAEILSRPLTSFELQTQSLDPATVQVLEALFNFQSCLSSLSGIVSGLREHLAAFMSVTTLPTVPFGTKYLHRPDVSFNGQTAVNIVSSNPTSTDSSITSNDYQFGKKPKSSPGGCKLFPAVFKYIGLILALFASVCISMVTLVVKFMDGYHPVTKVVWRLQGILLPALVIILFVKFYQKKDLIIWSTDMGESKKTWKMKIILLLVARGITGGTADIFQYYSLKYLPLADSTVISFSTPIFVCIVAHFLLKEKLGLIPILSALLTLCGVIVISKPPILTGEETINSSIMIGNALAISCMICGTFTIVLMRRLKNVHFALTMFALGMVGTVEGFFVSLLTSPLEFPRISMGYHDLILAGLTAGLFFFGQLAHTLSLQYEEAGVVSLVRTCDVLFAFVWQVTCLNQKATIYSYLGALIVTSGVCITAARKWVNDLPEHHPIRNRLYFLLK